MASSIDIGTNELRQYIVSSRSCNISSSGCKLLPKQSRVVFDFSTFTNVDRCLFKARNIGGNGIINIVHPVAGELVINSKSEQISDIKLDKKNILNISRPLYSTGEVEIFAVTLYAKEGMSVENSKAHKNWKQILTRCGTNKGLRLVNGKLFASEGGFICNANVIKNVETDPPNLYRKVDDKIRFNASCRILNIDIEPIIKKTQLEFKQEAFSARSRPSPAIIVEEKIAEPVYKNPNVERVKTFVENKCLNNLLNNIIYNSTSMRGFDIIKNSPNNFVKHINSNNQDYILLKTGGYFSLPTSLLQPNTKYICVITAKKFNGNGNLFIGLSPRSIPKYEKIVVDSNVTNKYISFYTDELLQYGEFYKIHFCMNDASTGEILLNKILIVEDIDVVAEVSNIPKDFDQIIVDYNSNNIHYNTFKKYARYNDVLNASNTFTDITGSFSYSTVSGMRWVNKVKSFLPNVNIIKDHTNEDVLLVSKVGCLTRAKKIWLDVFDKISDSDIEILKSAEKIFTPSMANQQLLNEKLPNAKIYLSYKPLPLVIHKQVNYFSNKNYVLAFDKNSVITDYLLGIWNNSLPSLMLIGARGKYPPFVLPVNEYLPYDQLLFLIQKAKSVIDITEYSEYESSFLHLVDDAGLPIIGNNASIFSCKNGIYISNSNRVNNIEVPAGEAIVSAIEESVALNKTGQWNNDYNHTIFVDKITGLFS